MAMLEIKDIHKTFYTYDDKPRFHIGPFPRGNARRVRSALHVLNGVDLSVEKGDVVAILGPSGSGKSTIAKLIAGFWDVTGGSVALGGVDLRKIPLEQLNRQIAYVSQDNYLFNRSIRENIRMGRPSATDAEVEQAAKQSGCDAFIQAG